MSRSLILAVAIALFVAAAANAACSNYYGCTTCTASNSGTCGWAADLNQCLAGTSVGPNFGSSSDWLWTSADCICSNYYSCSSCTANSNCGWTSNNACVASTSAGAMSWCYSVDYVGAAGLSGGAIMILIILPIVILVGGTTWLCLVCCRRRAVPGPVQTYATYGVAQPIAGGATVGVVAV